MYWKTFHNQVSDLDCFFSVIMPRTHHRPKGARRYNDTPTSNVEQAVTAVNISGVSIYAAASKFSIPYGTLYNKIKGLHGKTIGCPQKIPLVIENDVVAIVEFCDQMKCGLDGYDIRCTVQTMLNNAGIKSRTFNDNMPGRDWLASVPVAFIQ